jgi:hypothetical protein
LIKYVFLHNQPTLLSPLATISSSLLLDSGDSCTGKRSFPRRVAIGATVAPSPDVVLKKPWDRKSCGVDVRLHAAVQNHPLSGDVHRRVLGEPSALDATPILADRQVTQLELRRRLR